MFKKIFRCGYITSMVVLFLSFSLTFGVLFEYFETRIFSELKNEADYIAHALENEGISYIEHFNKKDKRITLVNKDGTVLADTAPIAKNMENHSDRKEIKEALEKGEGESFRYSNTLMEKTLYYAKKTKDGTILRVSATQKSVFLILLGILQPVIVIIILALIISFCLSNRVSKSIVEPINSLDLEEPLSNDTYEELTPLLKKLSAQKKTIDKQIADAKRKQEEFRLITENMSEGLLVIDNDYNVLSHNASALRLLKIDNVQNTSVFAFNRTRNFRETLEKALEGKRAEKTISHEDKIYDFIASPVFEGESVIGAVSVIIDITESAKNEQLRREFTSNVSHELKTPLTSISGFAEILKAGGISEENVVDFSSSIYEEAQRLISLVSDIMKISELDEGGVGLETENVDLYELSQNIVARLGNIAKKKNVSLNVIGDVAFVKGTRKILDEMIYNLCDNAIKYNKENGLVDIIINTNEENVNITVRDTGIGIPLSHQERVFERFYRVDKSHSKLIGGTGLGLAIVKHGAMYHNAKISLKSKENEGTSITLSFEK